MANIRKAEPRRQVAKFDPFDSPFEDMLRGLFVRPMSLGSHMFGDALARFVADLRVAKRFLASP